MTVEGHREALSHFRTLEPYLDRVTKNEQAAILDDWARIEFYLDNPAALDILTRAIDLHRSSGADRALARALTFAVRLNEMSGRPHAAEACSAEAIAILESHPPSGDLAFAVSQRAWLWWIRGAGDRALEFADRAISTAEQLGDQRTIIHSLNTKGSELCRRGDLAGFEVLEECRRRAEQLGYFFEEARALTNRRVWQRSSSSTSNGRGTWPGEPAIQPKGFDGAWVLYRRDHYPVEPALRR